MKLKWYLQTWFICLCFILIVPVILGIVLLIKQHLFLKKIFNDSILDDKTKLEIDINNLNKEKQKLLEKKKKIEDQNKKKRANLKKKLSKIIEKINQGSRKTRIQKRRIHLEFKLSTLDEEIKGIKYANILILVDQELNEKRSMYEKHTLISNMEHKKALFNKNIQEKEDQVTEIEKKKKFLEVTITEYKNKLNIIKDNLVTYEEEEMMQSFGFHNFKYIFGSSDLYKVKLEQIKEKQKKVVKDDDATESQSWTVNGNKRDGESLRKGNVKLVIRAFNQECDTAILRVKYNNFEIVKKQLFKAFDQLNKISEKKGVQIRVEYLELKIDELTLFYEHQVKKEEEKEEQRQIKERMREEKKVQDEIEREKKKLKKDEQHFNNALNNYEKQLTDANESMQVEIEIKMAEIKLQIEKIKKEKEIVDYREQNARAGYVYIISNIGSFGSNVYKIGMTRRLEPLERINELGSASVPFNFDVHAMIFSDDAPNLERTLHRSFDNYQVNRVNPRKEFFNVTLEQIVEEVKQKHDSTVEFTMIAEAEDYRKSQKINEGKLENQETIAV